MQDNVSQAGGSSDNTPWTLPEQQRKGQLGIRPIVPETAKESAEAKIVQDVPKDHTQAPRADLSKKHLSVSGHRKISQVGQQVLLTRPKRSLIPFPNKLQECLLKVPTMHQQSLRLLLQGGAKAKWDKEMGMLAAKNSQAGFAKDAPRLKLQIQNSSYNNDPQAQLKVEKQVDALLQVASGLKGFDGQDRLSAGQLVTLRNQLLNLLQQEAFVLDEEQYLKFFQAYNNPEAVTRCSEVAARGEDSMSEEELAFTKNTPLRLTFAEDGKSASISGVQLFRVMNASEELFGYDAISFEVHIDLAAIMPPDFLLGPSCAQVTTQTHGFHPSLTDLEQAIFPSEVVDVQPLQAVASPQQQVLLPIVSDSVPKSWEQPLSKELPLASFNAAFGGAKTGSLEKLVPQASIKVNDQAYAKDAAAISERLDAELRHVLQEKIGATRIARARTQLENLFGLDQQLKTELQTRYGGEVVLLGAVKKQDLTPIEAHLLTLSETSCTIVDSQLTLSQESFVRVYDKAGSFLGYDALVYTVQIDLSKIKEPDLLFTKGAGSVRLQSIGLNRNLEAVEYRCVGPHGFDTTLDACFDTEIGMAINRRRMKDDWQKETKGIQGKEDEHSKAFVSDAVRADSIRLNGYLQLKDETLIGEGLFLLLKAQLPNYSDELLHALRFEVENMTNQRLFALDERFMQSYDRSYNRFANQVHLQGNIDPDLLEKAEKKSGFVISIVDNKIEIVGTRYFQLLEMKDPDNEYVGYEALRATLTIDLSKVDPEKRLLSPGCGRLHLQTSGYAKQLEDLPF